jgi:hypothetical protein
MNAKYERYVNYIVDDLIKSSSVEIYEKPVGRWVENPETKEMELNRYYVDVNYVVFKSLDMEARNPEEIIDDEGDFNYYLNHYIEDLYGVKVFSREADMIIDRYAYKVFEVIDTLPTTRKER